VHLCTSGYTENHRACLVFFISRASWAFFLIYYIYACLPSGRVEYLMLHGTSLLDKFFIIMETALLIGQILFGGYFLVMGSMHFTQYKMMHMMAKQKGTPLAGLATVVGGLFLILGGLGILFWTQVGISVLLLIIFLFFAALFIHNFWALKDPMDKMIQMVNFMRNIGLIGALLIIYSIM